MKTVAECGLERYFKIMEGNLRRCAGWSSKPVGAVRQSQWVRLPLSSANLFSWAKNLKKIVSFRLFFVQKNTHQNYDGCPLKSNHSHLICMIKAMKNQSVEEENSSNFCRKLAVDRALDRNLRPLFNYCNNFGCRFILVGQN